MSYIDQPTHWSIVMGGGSKDSFKTQENEYKVVNKSELVVGVPG